MPRFLYKFKRRVAKYGLNISINLTDEIPTMSNYIVRLSPDVRHGGMANLCIEISSSD